MSERDSLSGQGSGQRYQNPAFSVTREMDMYGKKDSMLGYKNKQMAKASVATGFQNNQSSAINSKYLSPRERILARMQ